MTTPLGPVEPEPTGATPIIPSVPSPAPDGAATAQDINDMVAGIYKMVMQAVPKDPYRKATIVAVNTGSPSTIDIQFPAPTNTDGSPGTPVTVSDIRFIDSFSPTVGDTVILGQIDTDVFGIGQMTNAPSTASTVNGWILISGKNLKYRKVVDNGDWKVQLQGSYVTGGSATLFTLPSGYIPNVDREFTVSNNGSSGTSRIHIQGGTGVVSIVTGFTSTDASGTGSTSSVDPADGTTFDGAGTTTYVGDLTDVRLSGYLSQAGSDLGHSHNNLGHTHNFGSHNHGITGSHSHTGPSHTHSISPGVPPAVWFDNVEFFLIW